MPLPRRETLSCQFACVNVANVIGVNLAISVNAATINSQAKPWRCSTSPRSRCRDPDQAAGVLLWRTRRPQHPPPEHTRADHSNTHPERTPDTTSHREPQGRDGDGHWACSSWGRSRGRVCATRPYLVRRIDDQVVQLSELLHLVVVHAEPPRTSAEIADAVSAAYGRTLTAEGVEHLIATRLEPLGLVVADEAEEPLRPRAGAAAAGAHPQGHAAPGSTYARPRRAARAAVLAADRARRRSSPSSPPTSCWSPAAASGGGHRGLRDPDDSAADLRPARRLGRRPRARATRPPCRYGGAEPGEIGVGVYIVFPAFYTDVTDSYRLGRGGRVRTDLGGLYFNVLTVLALVARAPRDRQRAAAADRLRAAAPDAAAAHPGRAVRRLLHPLRPRRRPGPLLPRRARCCAACGPATPSTRASPSCGRAPGAS